MAVIFCQLYLWVKLNLVWAVTIWVRATQFLANEWKIINRTSIYGGERGEEKKIRCHNIIGIYSFNLFFFYPETKNPLFSKKDLRMIKVWFFFKRICNFSMPNQAVFKFQIRLYVQEKRLGYCNVTVATTLLMDYWTISSSHELITAESTHTFSKYFHLYIK